MRRWWVLLLLVGMLPPGSVEAQVYRWVDESGVIHYSTELNSVPERYRREARPLHAPPSPSTREEPKVQSAGVTRIPFTPGSPILVSAKINGLGSVTLILDTGADRTVVAPAALSRLGISTASATRGELRGVTGSSPVDLVGVTSVEVGEAKAGPLSIVSHDAELRQAEGLLGRDFLQNFTVTIDSKERVVTLTPR